MGRIELIQYLDFYLLDLFIGLSNLHLQNEKGEAKKAVKKKKEDLFNFPSLPTVQCKVQYIVRYHVADTSQT